MKKIPSRCPKCKKRMEKKNISLSLRSIRCKKEDHEIYFMDNDKWLKYRVISASITLKMDPEYPIRAVWDFDEKEFRITKCLFGYTIFSTEKMVLPFFEPDFSDYEKLINKLNTYLMFS